MFYYETNILLIIHNDQGTQFSSKTYYQFTQSYKESFQPRCTHATPTDNSVANDQQNF